MPTSQIDLREFKKEVMNYLYQKLYSYDPRTRVTQSSTTLSGDDSTQYFFLSNSLRFISTVTIGGSGQSYGTNWTLITDPDDDNYGSIYFSSAPTTGSNNISVTYGTGKGWIYSDFNRADLSISSLPRISVTFMKTIIGGGINAAQHILNNDVRMSILYVSEDRNNSRMIDKLEYNATQSLIQDAKTFYNFKYLRPDARRELLLGDDSTQSVLALNTDFIIPNRYEIVSYSS